MGQVELSSTLATAQEIKAAEEKGARDSGCAIQKLVVK